MEISWGFHKSRIAYRLVVEEEMLLRSFLHGSYLDLIFLLVGALSPT